MRRVSSIGSIVAACLPLAIGACTTMSSPGDVTDTTKATLGMSVGTINDSFGTFSALVFGGGGPGAGTYLNAVATFRNQSGGSAFTDPGSASLNGGASNVQIGGLFSYGQAPLVNGVGGMPPAYSPPNSASSGYATGFIYTGLPVVAGQYSIVISLSVNGQMRKYKANATLPPAPTILPADAGGSYAPDGLGDGGGTFTFAALPAGVTESVAYIACGSNPGAAPPDPCAGAPAGTPVASASVKMGGALSVVLPAGTLVSGDAYQAVVVGADYPLVEAGPPLNTQVTPVLTGANGTSNLTASALVSFAG